MSLRIANVLYWLKLKEDSKIYFTPDPLQDNSAYEERAGMQ